MNKTKQALLNNAASIFLCFLLTSIGFFFWINCLGARMDWVAVDVISTVIGYLLQAAGILLYTVIARRFDRRMLFTAALLVYTVFLVPVAVSHTVVSVVGFGLADSLLCGVIAGHYLYQLTFTAAAQQRAAAFGISYGTASIASWLFSLIPHFYENGAVILVCAVLAACAALGAAKAPIATVQAAKPPSSGNADFKKRLSAIAVAVLLFSLVNNLGFATQAGSDWEGVALEFSRVFYAVGLIAAGIVSDKSRKNGAVCALAALAIPFIALALQGEPIPLTISWGLGYFGFGFYAVYRIILFSDLAMDYDVVGVAGFGLLFGRLGDTVGSGINLLLKNRLTWQITAAAVLFAVYVFAFFKLYQLLYIPRTKLTRTEQEIFHTFAAKHDLSQREREVLKLLINEKSNKEIAEALFVSESTVKFHIHNLLKKTGAKTRLELLSLYHEAAQS